MSEPPLTTHSPAILDLPERPPYGGSKWAARFGGPRAARLAAPQMVTRQNATVHPDGRVTTEPSRDEAQGGHVFALPAGHAVSLGQFLTGPLHAAPPPPVSGHVFCGAPLTPRQTDVLARLGGLRGYIPLTAPRRFRAVTVAELPDGCLPGASVQPLMATLRAPQREQRGRIAILPRRESEKFCLTNRASLTAWLRAKQITVIDPEALRLRDLAETLAGTGLVLLADPSQAGLLGLCHPGTKILEIAPEGWLGAQARVMAALFALDWSAFLAAPPGYPLQGALPFGSLVACSYEIPIRELARALEAVGA